MRIPLFRAPGPPERPVICLSDLPVTITLNGGLYYQLETIFPLLPFGPGFNVTGKLTVEVPGIPPFQQITIRAMPPAINPDLQTPNNVSFDYSVTLLELPALFQISAIVGGKVVAAVYARVATTLLP